MDTKHEWELIRRCRAGQASAFEALVRKHEAPALALAGGLLGDADDAADAVQDAFVRAYRTLDRLAEGSAFGPWFRTILRNLCLDRLRSPRRRRRERWSPETLDRRAWTEPAAPQALERRELTAAVHAALAELSPEHRQVLVLREMEGFSYAEIAETLGISAGTVASRLYHARARMKQALLARASISEEVSP